MAKKPAISFAIPSCSFLLLLVSLSDARSASDLLFKVDLTEVSHPDGKILLPTEKLHELAESSVPSSSTAAPLKHPQVEDVPDRFDGPGEEEDHKERSHDGNVLTVRYRPMKMRLDQPWMVRRFFHRRFSHGQRRHPFETPHHHHHHHHEDGLFDDKEQGDTSSTSTSNVGKVEEHHHHANRLPEFARVGILLASNGVDLMFGEPHHYRHHHFHPHHHDDDHHFHHHDDDAHHFHHHDDDEHHFHHHDDDEHHFHHHDDEHHFHHHDDDHMMMRRKRFGVWKSFKKLLTHF